MSSIKDLIEYKVKKEKLVKCVRTENTKIKYLRNFKIFIYKNKIDGTEHLALVKGKVSANKNILEMTQCPYNMKAYDWNIFVNVILLVTH